MRLRWKRAEWQATNKNAYSGVMGRLENEFGPYRFGDSDHIVVSRNYSDFSISLKGPVLAMLKAFPELAEIAGPVEFTPQPTGEEPLE